MNPTRIDLRTLPPQPWKNGAGLTRELAWGGADAATFDWRLSLAEVTRDAPFSAFLGVDRCIVLMDGDGLRLRSADATIDHALTVPLQPFEFPGDVPLSATLVGGATSDFNVMTRRGVYRSVVDRQAAACELPPCDVALALCVSGSWAIEGDAPLLPLQAMLWRAPAKGRVTLQPRHADATLVRVRLLRTAP